VGDALSLFAAGIALFALFIASYSRRGTWIALGSMAMSMALLFGCLFLATSLDQSQVRTRLAWIASKLPLVLEQKTIADLAASLERARLAASPASPSPAREAMQAAATSGWLETKPDPKETLQYPVAWRLEGRDVQPASSSDGVFLISGTNVSDQALEEVHAVLKPDASQRGVELALSVEGRELEDKTVIPAEARFSLVAANPNGDGSNEIRGAILTFRYVQAGQRKTSILYLTPAMVSRIANRG
jgi:hypothetical protein